MTPLSREEYEAFAKDVGSSKSYEDYCTAYKAGTADRRKAYTNKYKDYVVAFVDQNKYGSIASVAKLFELDSSMLSRWCKENAVRPFASLQPKATHTGRGETRFLNKEQEELLCKLVRQKRPLCLGYRTDLI